MCQCTCGTKNNIWNMCQCTCGNSDTCISQSKIKELTSALKTCICQHLLLCLANRVYVDAVHTIEELKMRYQTISKVVNNHYSSQFPFIAVFLFFYFTTTSHILHSEFTQSFGLYWIAHFYLVLPTFHHHLTFGTSGLHCLPSSASSIRPSHIYRNDSSRLDTTAFYHLL
jgi:hypothetical protein